MYRNVERVARVVRLVCTIRRQRLYNNSAIDSKSSHNVGRAKLVICCRLFNLVSHEIENYNQKHGKVISFSKLICKRAIKNHFVVPEIKIDRRDGQKL